MTTRQERLIALGRLSSVLAHEIRNPLAGISAATQLLDGRISGHDPGKKYVGMILKEVERVEGIVKSLLDFSRDGRPCMMRVDVGALAEHALQEFDEACARAGVRAECCHDAGPPSAMCDAEKMRRVLHNLVENALDAMPNGGWLMVRTAYDEASDQVAVVVEDTGVGTEVQDLGELFSPFYTTKTKGSGLGLPVALKFVEEHGGTITAERREPRGLAVTVRWPAEPAGSPGHNGT